MLFYSSGIKCIAKYRIFCLLYFTVCLPYFSKDAHERRKRRVHFGARKETQRLSACTDSCNVLHYMAIAVGMCGMIMIIRQLQKYYTLTPPPKIYLYIFFFISKYHTAKTHILQGFIYSGQILYKKLKKLWMKLKIVTETQLISLINYISVSSDQLVVFKTYL